MNSEAATILTQGDTIEFEKLDENHFPLLLRWLNTPHVKKWWGQEIHWDSELIKEKYDSYVKNFKLVNGSRKVIQPYIIKVDSKSIGYT